MLFHVILIMKNDQTNINKPVYIDPTTDFGFKRIFASEPNKDLLIAFINELFRGNKSVVDLSYDKNEFVGDTGEMGSVILDLTCTASNGERDRKSTRLNSSYVKISYAVFCLKKKMM